MKGSHCYSGKAYFCRKQNDRCHYFEVSGSLDHCVHGEGQLCHCEGAQQECDDETTAAGTTRNEKKRG